MHRLVSVAKVGGELDDHLVAAAQQPCRGEQGGAVVTVRLPLGDDPVAAGPCLPRLPI
ncbi:MAG TPA: hypothetical protein VHH53_12880 [Pseudonocardiaceae bacterium]|nr:hypothetical protein [Pseudonocardiaceae bacterium]